MSLAVACSEGQVGDPASVPPDDTGSPATDSTTGGDGDATTGGDGDTTGGDGDTTGDGDPTGGDGDGDGDGPAGPSVRVAIVSDINGSFGSTTYEDSVHLGVAAIVDGIRPDVVLVTGDMVAGQKPARDGLNYQAMWDGFFAAVADPLTAAGIPIVAVPGNHDASGYSTYTHEREIYERQWTAPGRVPEVSFIDDSHYPFYFAFEVAGALFIALDATTVGPLDDAQRAWLEQTLEAVSDYDVKIAFGHIPLHPVTQGRQTEVLDDPELEALFKRHDLTLFAAGHHHGYYPGAAQGVRQLSMPNLGGGPRVLIGQSQASPQGLAVLDIRDGVIEQLEAYTGDLYDEPIERATLPESIVYANHRLIRDDLDAAPEPPSSDLPVVPIELPFSTTSTTVGAPTSVIDAYSCIETTNESGPERIYEFTLTASATVTAYLHEAAPVDVDVHILSDLEIEGRIATGCEARGHRAAQATLPPGTHYIVVDTFAGPAQAGAYSLFVDVTDEQWHERPVARGVVHRWRRFTVGGRPQYVNVLEVDPAVPGLEIRAIAANGCETIHAIGERVGAVAGVNGGYFGAGCEPLSMIRSGGATLARNARTRGTFGMAGQVPLIELIEAGADWPAATEASGGGPLLVRNGAATGEAQWTAEGLGGAFANPNPRSWAGIDASGSVFFGTVDGRYQLAGGMSLGELTAFAREQGAVEAVNFDGGGSTALWIADGPEVGVVNLPSDGTPRGVSGGVFVFAPPL